MLPNTHSTSHSRISGSRWVATLSWLSRSLRPVLYSSVYSRHLFLISSASVSFLPFLSFIMTIFVWNVPLVSPILLKRSLVFPLLLFSSTSLHCSLKKAFLSLLAVLWNSAISWVYLSLSPLFLFFSQLFLKTPHTTILPSYIYFSLGWFWSLPPEQCYKPLSILLQALSLPALIPWIYSSPSLYNNKEFDLGYPRGSSCFLYFLNLSLNFAIRHDLSHSQLHVLFLLTV